MPLPPNCVHTAGSLRLLIIMATEKWYGQNRTGRTGRAGPGFTSKHWKQKVQTNQQSGRKGAQTLHVPPSDFDLPECLKFALDLKLVDDCSQLQNGIFHSL